MTTCLHTCFARAAKASVSNAAWHVLLTALLLWMRLQVATEKTDVTEFGDAKEVAFTLADKVC